MSRGSLDEIDGYTVEKSKLWDINNAIIMDDHRIWNHTNILEEPHILPFIEYVKRTFEGVPAEIIKHHADKETVIKIIDKYKGVLLNQDKWKELQHELIACDFIFESNHMWKAISELGGYVVRPRNRKRQEYIIESTPLIEESVQIYSPFPERLKTFEQSQITISTLSINMLLENSDVFIFNLQAKGFWQSRKYVSSLKILNNLFSKIAEAIQKESKPKIFIILPKNYVIRSESKKYKQIMLKDKIHWVGNHLMKLNKNIILGVFEKPRELSIGKYMYTADFHFLNSDGTDKTTPELSEVTTLAVAKNCWLTTLNVLRDVAYLKNYLEYVDTMKEEIEVGSDTDVVCEDNVQTTDAEVTQDYK